MDRLLLLLLLHAITAALLHTNKSATHANT